MNWLAELKSKIDIVDFIRSDGVDLKTDGTSRYGSKCPFHNEKTPSFKVSETYQNYKCFGCGESGDVISFFAKRNILDYYTAANILAEKYGIKITQNNEELDKMKRFFSILKDLEDYYKEEFSKLTNHHPAKKEILRRNLEITADFGYAPSDNTSVVEHLTKDKKYNIEDLKELGIVNENDVTQLRNRLVFFIRNYMGKTVGFTGRELSEKPSNYKYVNSKASIIYDKQVTLYNIDSAKDYAKKFKSLYIVEGQFDVIAMKQKGYPNVVAISGTAMTEKHLKEIKRCIGEDGKIILTLDSDKAGLKSVIRSFKDLPSAHKNLEIVLMSKGFDPCDWLKENQKLPLSHNLLKFLFDYIKASNNLTTPDGRTKFIKKIQENFTKYIRDVQLREQYLRTSCVLAGVDYNNLQILTKTDFNTTEEITVKENKLSSLPVADQYYIYSLACYISNKELFNTKIDSNKYPNKYKNFIEELNSDTNKVFLSENYTNERLATIISEIQAEVFEDLELAKIHYRTLYNHASNIDKREKQANNISNVINNIEGLDSKQMLELLKQLNL